MNFKGKTAFVTGAGKGIGRAISVGLASLGANLVIADINEEILNETELQVKALGVEVRKAVFDVSDEDAVTREMNAAVEQFGQIHILVNNAGFGTVGKFVETNLDFETQMIDTNCVAVHILMKLFLKDMKKRNSGYILNVASSAAFGPGPLMATYYATKSYVYNLTMALHEELRKINSNVKVSCLCPGPVDTNFNNVAGVNFSVKPLSPNYVAKYAVDKMLANKGTIIPGIAIKSLNFIKRIVPTNLLLHCTYYQQKRKN